MNQAAHQEKIAKLLEVKTANYRAAGIYHPEVAAQFAVLDIINMYKNQTQYFGQLIDEAIEDAMKASARC